MRTNGHRSVILEKGKFRLADCGRKDINRMRGFVLRSRFRVECLDILACKLPAYMNLFDIGQSWHQLTVFSKVGQVTMMASSKICQIDAQWEMQPLKSAMKVYLRMKKGMQNMQIFSRYFIRGETKSFTTV